MIAYVAVGSNLGDREASVTGAIAALAGLDGVSSLSATVPEETEPLWGLDQPAYLNAMARFDWAGTPAGLLEELQRIEVAGGRMRDVHWGSRTLDLDLVRLGDVLSGTTDLTLPHPGLRDRIFWIRQIAELESDV